MIKKLYIQNFRNIKELIIEPSKYVNLISGNNGEGKSSILYAIEYLLTDNLNEKISEYVRWGCEKFFLELEFEINNDNYLIKVFASASAKKELIINNDSFNIYKNSEATKKLAEIIDPNIIRYSSISEQGKTAQILFDTPTNRLKKLKEILGIDKIAEVCEEIKIDIDKQQEEIRIFDRELKLLEEKKYNFMEVPKVDNIEDIKKQLEILELEKKNYELQLVVYNTYIKDLSSYVNANREIEIYDAQILEFKRQIENLEKLLKTIDSEINVDNLNNQIIDLEKEQVNQLAKNEKYLYKKDKIKKAKDGIIRNNELLNQYQLKQISPYIYKNSDIEKAEEQLIRFESERIQFEKDFQLSEQGKCPTCGAIYEGNIEQIRNDLLLCKKEILEYKNKVKEIKENLKEYTTLVNEQETIKIQRKNIQDNIDNHQKELDELLIDFVEKELEVTFDFRRTIDNFKQRIKNYNETISYNNSIKEQIKDLENKIETSIKLQEQYSNIKKPQKVDEPINYDKIKYDILNREIIIYEQKLQEKERVTNYNENIEKEKQEDNQKIKSLISLIDSISYKVSILKEVRQVLDKDFSAWLIDQGAEYIKEKMNYFFLSAYDKYSITFSQDKNSIDFYYVDKEQDCITPCSMASGSEKDLLALSFRVALSSLDRLNFMILDEIDSQLSEEKAVNMFEILLEHLPNYQIFIISHCEEVKEFLKNTKGSKSFYVDKGEIK